MRHTGVITSVYVGTVVEMKAERHAHVREGEVICTIQTQDGRMMPVTAELSGEIVSMEVEVGDEVIPGMVLAYVKEDLFVTGDDDR